MCRVAAKANLTITNGFRDILVENLNMVESENIQLRDQIEDMERELDFKDKKLTEMEAELKIMRSERE